MLWLSGWCMQRFNKGVPKTAATIRRTGAAMVLVPVCLIVMVVLLYARGAQFLRTY